MFGGLRNQFILGVAMMAIAGIGMSFSKGSKLPKEQVVRVRIDDAAVSGAKAKAQAGLDKFFQRLRFPQPDESSFGLKYDLNWGHPERGEPEIIWTRDVIESNGKILAKLDNDPQTPGYKSGMDVEIPRAAIADWAIKVGDKFDGHFTTRVLVAQLPPEEAAQVLARLTPM
jgi:uncharacterized protein YegJ (DUF2314 family)